MIRIVASFLLSAIVGIISATSLWGQWKNISSEDGAFDFRGVSFISETTGYLAGWTRTFDHIDLWGIGRTTNEGGEFLWQSGVNLELTGLRFHDLENGFLIGRDPECNCPIVVNTTNGGVDWPNTSFAQIHGAFASLDFADPLHGVFAGGDPATGEGLIVRTTDGGMSFAPILQRGGMYVSQIGQIDRKTLVIGAGAGVGRENAIWKTTNADAEPESVEWSLVYTFEGLGGIKGLDFVDGENGYLIFAPFENPDAIAEIYKTTNGGAAWERVYRSAEFALTALDFLDVDHGFAVGSGGAILHTTDGGKHWSDTVVGVTPLLLAVDYVSPAVAYAVGAEGTILRYDARSSGLEEEPGIAESRNNRYVEVLSGGGREGIFLARKGNGYPSDSRLLLYDLLGNLVMEQPLDDLSGRYAIDGLNRGVYLLSVLAEGRVLQQERFLVP